ncbi:MAG: hypothetical protein ACREYA_15790 [Cupriavidus necator]
MVPKDKTLQIRLPAELLDTFRAYCDRNAVVGSELVRRWIQHYVEQEAKREAREDAAVRGVPAQSRPEPVADRAPVGQRAAVAARPVNQYGDVESRAERRAREKRERKGEQ